MFDPSPAESPSYGDLLNELRCHTTEWLRMRRDVLVREQRRLHLEELAVTRVLDDRGVVDDSLAQADGVSVRTVHETLATARALEDLPEIAAVAAEGNISPDQFTQLVKVVDPANPADDRRWAAEASSWSPADLAQEARLQRKPTVEEAAARRAAREFGFWWRRDTGMLGLRGELPDIDGALAERVFNHLIDQMKPAKGETWDTRAQRGADALMVLVRNYADVHAVAAPTVHMVVEVPLHGPATIVGIPLPDAMVERLRAHAKVEPVLVDHDGEPVTLGKTESLLSDKVKRVVRQRDGKCRWPGCDRRIALEVHHLVPRSWGGTDDLWNLATVCGTHHAQLAPQGDRLLLGNPNNPAGLSLVHRDDAPRLGPRSGSDARAGPTAA